MHLRGCVLRKVDDILRHRLPVAKVKQRDVEMLGQDQVGAQAVLRFQVRPKRCDTRARLRIRQAGKKYPLLLRGSELAAGTVGGHGLQV
jgi:hypothetical protein